MDVPSAEDVLYSLRSLSEDFGLGIFFDTSKIAEECGCSADVLYDHDADAGPLYDLHQRGDIMQSGSRKDGWRWSPRGRIEWDN